MRKWHLEDWRKIYTRMDASWLALPWVARGLASDLIKYAQADGTLADCRGEEPGTVLARLLCAHPGEAKLIAKATTCLLEDGYLVLVGTRIMVKNHAEAQEKLSPEARRKRRQRDKEQDAARDMTGDTGGTNGVTESVTSHAPRPQLVPGHSAGVESSRVESNLPSRAQGAHVGADARTSGLEAVVDDATTRHDGGAGAGGGARTWDGADLDAAWRKLYRRPTGAPGDVSQLAGLVRESAALRGEQPAELAQRFLGEFRDMLGEWKARHAHHGTPQVTDAIKHFGKVLDRLDADDADEPEQPDNPAYRRIPRAVRPPRPSVA